MSAIVQFPNLRLADISVALNVVQLRQEHNTRVYRGALQDPSPTSRENVIVGLRREATALSDNSAQLFAILAGFGEAANDAVGGPAPRVG